LDNNVIKAQKPKEMNVTLNVVKTWKIRGIPNMKSLVITTPILIYSSKQVSTIGTLSHYNHNGWMQPNNKDTENAISFHGFEVLFEW